MTSPDTKKRRIDTTRPITLERKVDKIGTSEMRRGGEEFVNDFEK
jgi:hypothetical protein